MAKCQICSKKFSSISSKQRHIREIHGNKRICPFCFDFYGRVSAHLLTCKKYIRHKLLKLKIVGSEIYYIEGSLNKLKPKNKNIQIRKSHSFDFYKRIGKTNYFFLSNIKIGKGSYCDVYYGINKINNQEYAIKVFENINNNYEKFLLEVGMLKKLKNEIFFPSHFYSSRKELIVIESLLGPNLEKLFNFCNNKFPISTVSYIGIESINRLKQFHSLGMVHRDIKPNNFVGEIFLKIKMILKITFSLLIMI